MVKHPWPLLEISLSDFRGLATSNINTYLPYYNDMIKHKCHYCFISLSLSLATCLNFEMGLTVQCLDWQIARERLKEMRQYKVFMFIILF